MPWQCVGVCVWGVCVGVCVCVWGGEGKGRRGDKCTS